MLRELLAIPPRLDQEIDRYLIINIKIRTLDKLSIREKVTNIATEHGEVIWKELNYPTETPTVFEVVGTTPMTDPFGDVLAWNSVLKRSENQQIGI